MTNNSFQIDDQIDLLKVFSILWDNKILISSVTFIFAILSIVISLSFNNIYTSKTLLAPKQDDQTLSSQLRGLSGLAGIAGIGIPNNSSSRSQEAIERIQSFDFFTNDFLPNIELKNLMALKKWDKEQDILIYKSNLYDIKQEKWVESPPTKQMSYDEYRGILQIDEDDKTGFITISVKHISPKISKKWVDVIIYNINESMRELDKETAKSSIEFLNDSAKSTSVQSVRDAISSLLESQMQKLMLASSDEAYVFKIIDSPIVPEKKSQPNRMLICIFGTLFGAILSILAVLILNSRESEEA